MADRAIILDDYEIVNLREILLFAGQLGGDTGDWYQQVLNKLPYQEHTVPNKSVQELKRQLALNKGWDLLWR